MTEQPGTAAGGSLTPAARLDAIVRANDIRGRVPAELDAPMARRLGAAFAAFFREDDPRTAEVVVGRDMRLSGPPLVDAFCDSVQAAGLDVVDLGLASTDTLYFASGHLGAPGVVFTASHNPADYNGIKGVPRRRPPARRRAGPAARARSGPRPAAAAGRAEPRAASQPSTCWTPSPATSARSPTPGACGP